MHPLYLIHSMICKWISEARPFLFSIEKRRKQRLLLFYEKKERHTHVPPLDKRSYPPSHFSTYFPSSLLFIDIYLFIMTYTRHKVWMSYNNKIFIKKGRGGRGIRGENMKKKGGGRELCVCDALSFRRKEEGAGSFSFR
jgi:hypothetical protein